MYNSHAIFGIGVDKTRDEVIQGEAIYIQYPYHVNTLHKTACIESILLAKVNAPPFGPAVYDFTQFAMLQKTQRL